jgi:hypothetical protein
MCAVGAWVVLVRREIAKQKKLQAVTAVG